MSGRGGPTMRRVLPSLALFAALLIVAALWTSGAHDAYFALFRLLGVPAYRFPFLDTHGVLAVVDCQRRGIDTYLTNPCDVMGRVHVYTPLWFRLAALPITAASTPIVGFGLAMIFAATLLLLAPARDARGAWVLCAAALSPAVAFAIERGNADLLIFALAALAGWLAARRLPTRLLSFPIVLLATALKLYPATLLILALRERLALCLAIAALSLGALLAYVAIDATGLREMLAVVPGGTPFIYSFGARNLPTGLGIVFAASPLVLTIALAILLITAAVFAASRVPHLRRAVATLTPAEAVGLLIGAALILGCFVMGQSGEYRAVHLLFVLPALIALASTSGPTQRLASGTAWVIVLQLWGDVVSANLDRFGTGAGGLQLLLWLTRELAWWWIAAVLLALLLAVLLDLPGLAVLRRRQGQLP
jgi:hypothetical protein